MEFFEAMESVRKEEAIKRPYMTSALTVFDVMTHRGQDMIEVPRTGTAHDYEIPGWFPAVVCDTPYDFPEEDIAATDWEVLP